MTSRISVPLKSTWNHPQFLVGLVLFGLQLTKLCFMYVVFYLCLETAMCVNFRMMSLKITLVSFVLQLPTTIFFYFICVYIIYISIYQGCFTFGAINDLGMNEDKTRKTVDSINLNLSFSFCFGKYNWVKPVHIENK